MLAMCGEIPHCPSMANQLAIEKKTAVISILCRCASNLAVGHIAGVNQNTIVRFGRRVGDV
jgi:hypothetical protein